MSWGSSSVGTNCIACSGIFRRFSNVRCYIIWIIWFRDSTMNNFWPWAGSLNIYFTCLPLILEPTCCQELWNSNHVLFFMTFGFRSSWLYTGSRHTLNIYYFQSLLGSLFVKLYYVFLRDLSEANNDFEHARYALTYCTLP